MGTLTLININDNIEMDATGLLGGKPNSGDRIILDGKKYTVTSVEFFITTEDGEIKETNYKVWMV